MTRLGEPPVDYLRQCSSTSLRYFEMSKLEHVANLRRELAVLLDEMMEESALALFARWMLEGRALPEQTSGTEKAASGTDARKIRCLLADFINGSLLSAGRGTGASGPSGKTSGGEAGTADAQTGRAVLGGSAEAAAREHATPHHPDARSERRLERRGSKPGRSSGRSTESPP